MFARSKNSFNGSGYGQPTRVVRKTWSRLYDCGTTINAVESKLASNMTGGSW